MPEWSPVLIYGGYGAWKAFKPAAMQAHACSCNGCSLHGHDHAKAWDGSPLPIAEADLKSFWGALGCSCWAV
jgi:hypothetical protein